MGRKAAYEPSGKRSRGRARGDNEQKARGFPAMGPSDQRIAKPIRLLKAEAEHCSDKASKRAGDKRDKRERQ